MTFLLVMTNFDSDKNRYKLFSDPKEAEKEGKEWMSLNDKNWYEIHAFPNDED